ncbi:hypothetical protein [Tepidibacillus marianensis]|uniref:hypothetical protein n=1 Tax=Tepidibacillus marianensis TaxID=3131995 RepID=UPI0030CC4489
MEELLERILHELSIIKSDMANFATKSDIQDVKNELIEIKQSVQRIEQSHPEDIHAMLQTINNKLDQRDSDVQVLNKRIFKVESDVERLTRA